MEDIFIDSDEDTLDSSGSGSWDSEITNWTDGFLFSNGRTPAIKNNDPPTFGMWKATTEGVWSLGSTLGHIGSTIGSITGQWTTHFQQTSNDVHFCQGNMAQGNVITGNVTGCAVTSEGANQTTTVRNCECPHGSGETPQQQSQGGEKVKPPDQSNDGDDDASSIYSPD